MFEKGSSYFIFDNIVTKLIFKDSRFREISDIYFKVTYINKLILNLS